MRKLISSFFVLLLMSVTTNLYAEPVLELEGMFWMPSLDAKAKVVENGQGTEVDFSEDLGVEDEDFTEIRLSIQSSANTKLRFGYSQVDYSGDAIITDTYIFDGTTYPIGNRVVSKLDMDYLRLGFLIDLNRQSKINEFGTILELKGFSGSASLNDLTLGVTEEEDFDVILPTIGLYFKTQVVPSLFMYGEISGLPAGSLGYLLDGEVGLRLQPFENLSVCAGYRMLTIDAEDDEDYAEVSTDGAFISAIISY